MKDIKPLKLGKSNHKLFGNLLIKLKKFKYVVAAAGLVIALLIGVGLWLRTSNTQVIHFVVNQIRQQPNLKTENNRVNVLLLGTAGGRHAGPNLTDTIMVASYDTKSRRVDLISLPRDIWLDSTKSKINAVYQIGLNKGDGLGLVRKEIGGVLGIEIPYAARIDFAGFEEAVDMVEGIEVNIPNSFDDYLYPVDGQEDNMCGYTQKEVDLSGEQSKALSVPDGKYLALMDDKGQIATVSADLTNGIVFPEDQGIKLFGCRYEHLSFKKGPMYLDGATALKFVRSRHGTNGEGSDFARSRRQQVVLQAFKDKALSLETLSDPQKVIGIITSFSGRVDTDIPLEQYLDFIKLTKQVRSVNSFVINEKGTNPLLRTPSPWDYGGAWVLVPTGGDYAQIHSFVQKMFQATRNATDSATLSN